MKQHWKLWRNRQNNRRMFLFMIMQNIRAQIHSFSNIVLAFLFECFSFFRAVHSQWSKNSAYNMQTTLWYMTYKTNCVLCSIKDCEPINIMLKKLSFSKSIIIIVRECLLVKIMYGDIDLCLVNIRETYTFIKINQ